jgi:hypothetical protein
MKKLWFKIHQQGLDLELRSLKKWNLKIYTNKSKSLREFIKKKGKENPNLLDWLSKSNGCWYSRVCVKWICNLWKIQTKNNVMLLKFLKSNKKRHYSFNINQDHAIFDRCSANKKVELKKI